MTEEDARRAVVTGASGGIGRALVSRLLDQGWIVFATYHRAPVTPAPGLCPVALDLLDERSIRDAAKVVCGTARGLDLLVNCAGANRAASHQPAGGSTRLESLSAGALEELMRVNVIGPLLMVAHMLPALRRGRRPHVMNFSSQRASPADARGGGKYGYRASKAALEISSIALAADLRDSAIRVSVVDPGWVRTAMGGEDAPDTPEEAAADIASLVDHAAMALSGVLVDRRGRPVDRAKGSL